VPSKFQALLELVSESPRRIGFWGCTISSKRLAQVFEAGTHQIELSELKCEVKKSAVKAIATRFADTAGTTKKKLLIQRCSLTVKVVELLFSSLAGSNISELSLI